MHKKITGNEEKYMSPVLLRISVTHNSSIFILTFDLILMVLRVHLALMKTPMTYQL